MNKKVKFEGLRKPKAGSYSPLVVLLEFRVVTFEKFRNSRVFRKQFSKMTKIVKMVVSE